MQHVSPYDGYITPPASPSFDHKCLIQVQQTVGTVPCQAALPRYMSVAPEERLGRFLAGSLQLTGILGTGAYGVVYSAADVKTSMRYAVKCLSKFNADGTPLDHRQVAFQNREIRLHHTASTHRNVVSMLKIIDSPDCIYVILEYCPEGDLFYNITERGHYVGKDELAKDVFLQILDAVEHCHSLGIYHRDLKPENILVTDQGRTAKLADFGLATASERSDDYGCGSTFYMSPECLDHSSRKPFYFCAPNDVWSLGVILVNLTCGRNPWKQASVEDSTYRAYSRCPDFLKTILPVSDDLNDILARIFTRDPETRITLSELRQRVMACPRFTEQQQKQHMRPCAAARPASRPALLPVVTPPVSPSREQQLLALGRFSYVHGGDSAIEDDDDFDYEDSAPSSPYSDCSMSDSDDSESTCSTDDGSVSSGCSSLDELESEDEDVFCDVDEEPHEAKTPPPPALALQAAPAIYDPEQQQQDFGGIRSVQPPQYPLSHHPQVVALRQSLPTGIQPGGCASKFSAPFGWDSMVLKYAQLPPPPPPSPQLHHPVPFHLQCPFLTSWQGCS